MQQSERQHSANISLAQCCVTLIERLALSPDRFMPMIGCEVAGVLSTAVLPAGYFGPLRIRKCLPFIEYPCWSVLPLLAFCVSVFYHF